ncbi:hypothetical protein [Streptomyces erythrochromogenes]|uniref:hypothetical protein n=1 Tax=Streptomyces erythrochromogenes TaxID=285574 RepID=UPI0036A25E4F
MITFQLIGSCGTAPAPSDVRDFLTAHLAPADRIEHVTATAGGSADRIDLVFFALADTEAEALLTARGACLRALDRAPELIGWRLSDGATGDGPGIH